MRLPATEAKAGMGMSESKVIVSPGELYVVGRILNAKYIDYAYVAAVQDIGASFELFEKETTDKLVLMGILEGDFSGSVTPKAETVGLFTPVFFGTVETTLDICTIKEPTKIDTYKFHFFDDQITKVTGASEGLLEMESIGSADLAKVVDDLSSGLKSTDDAVEFSKESVSRFIVAKSNHVGDSSLVATFMESNDRMYKEDAGGNVVLMSAEDFKTEISQILTGVK